MKIKLNISLTINFYYKVYIEDSWLYNYIPALSGLWDNFNRILGLLQFNWGFLFN